MQYVEFLPPRYRHRRRSQQTLLRNVAALGAAAAVIASLSAWQHRQERAAREAWLEADARYSVAHDTNERLEQVRSELAAVRAGAELCVFLNRPWPRSQMLAAIAAAAPEELELTELRVSYEAIPTESESRSSGARAGRAKEKAPQLPAALRDLQRLREQFDSVQTVVHISGIAGDSAALHRFVAALGEHRLFVRADLGSQEAVAHPQRGSVTKFAARVVVRPEYGHPRGPSGSAVAAVSGRGTR
ncbi:MAG: hypothetical protein KY475_16440 [Planctomycetes bacterium]|nr:hypothetical protein [Planctomycetota bacterium]